MCVTQLALLWSKRLKDHVIPYTHSHKVCGLISSIRSVISNIRPHYHRDLGVSISGNNELDSHADTCALGRNFIRLHDTMQTASVSPYSKQYQAVDNVPIVTGATAVQLPETGETIILVVHQALWLGESLENSLLNPNQLQHNDTEVYDNP